MVFLCVKVLLYILSLLDGVMGRMLFLAHVDRELRSDRTLMYLASYQAPSPLMHLFGSPVCERVMTCTIDHLAKAPCSSPCCKRRHRMYFSNVRWLDKLWLAKRSRHL